MRRNLTNRMDINTHYLTYYTDDTYLTPNNNFGLGSSSTFYPLEALQPVWLTPEVYCTIPCISNHSYYGRQVPLVSITCGSPLAARGGTMGGNNGQMMPGICTQASLTCRKSAT
jgi:hypothetical protein